MTATLPDRPLTQPYLRETSGSLRFGLIDGPWPDVRRGHVEAVVLAMALEEDLLERARVLGGRG